VTVFRRLLTGAAALAVLWTAGCAGHKGCCHKNAPPAGPACCPEPGPYVPGAPAPMPPPPPAQSFFGQAPCCSTPAP
jgi:hypothetical protein